MISILAYGLVALGAFQLGKLIVKGVKMTVNWLKKKLAEKLRDRGDTIAIGTDEVRIELSKIIQTAVEEKKPQFQAIDDLFKDDDGLITVSVNKEEDIDPDTIDIDMGIMDADVRELLNKNNGMIAVKAA